MKTERYKYLFQLVGFGKYELKKEVINEPRAVGFYWVKYPGGNGWTIGEWNGAFWQVMNDSASLKDYNFDMIYEEPIEKPII